jgi:CheY-like chemotaxis protein
VTAAVVFDATCAVLAAGVEESTEGRILLGPRQLVLATDTWRRTIPVTDIFDVVDVAESPTEVRVGYEYEKSKRVDGGRFGDRAEAERFVDSLFSVCLNDATVRVRVGGETTTARFQTGSEACRLHDADGRVRTVERVRRLTLDGDGDWIRVAYANRSGSAEMAVAFDRPGQRNLAGRYLYRLSDPADETPADAGGDDIRVLLVDDDSGFAEIATVFLPRANEHIVVETASDVETGLKRLSRAPAVDCVISDYRMPETSGLSFLKAVRERSADLPFLMLTGRGNEGVAAEAVNHGATGYLMKDTDTAQFATIAERVENVVRAHRTHGA